MFWAGVGKPFELWAAIDYTPPLSVIINWLDPFLGKILSFQGMLFVCLLKILPAHGFNSFLACVQVQGNTKVSVRPYHLQISAMPVFGVE